MSAAHLARIAREGLRAVAVEITQAKGSTPRGEDAFLIVDAQVASGTIGGGQLEYHALDIARTMIAGGLAATRQTIPLGPVMGQCCGGAVTLAFTPIDADTGRRLSQRLAGRAAARPKILAFGLGHTGRAFARIAAHLPYETTLVDDRPEAFRDLPEGIRALHCADPEAALAEAPAGAAILIFTHSHSLDYRLADAALRRGDASYVGMIGSATKRARFEAWFRQRGGGQAALARLTCPIGGADVADKRPEVIALLSAAEIARVFAKAREAAVRAEAVR